MPGHRYRGRLRSPAHRTDDKLSLAQGVLAPLSQPTTMERLKKPLEALGKRHGFTLDTPLKDFSEEAFKALFHGEPGGVTRNGSLRRNYLGGTSLNAKPGPTACTALKTP